MRLNAWPSELVAVRAGKSSRSKKRAIRASLRATKERRKQQVCKQYELKVDRSHLSHSRMQHLVMLFLEAKWFHNHLLAGGGLFHADYKLGTVRVKVKDHYETRQITHLSSQMRQELLDRMKDNVKGLSRLKKNEHKVGRLQFKSEINSIPLKHTA